MLRFEHNEIGDKLRKIYSYPESNENLINWLKAENHIQFMIENAKSNEIVIYAAPEYSFIHSLAVPKDMLEPLDKNDLMGWSANPFTSAASYSAGGCGEPVRIERDLVGAGSRVLSKGTNLIYGRTFEGWSGEDRSYFELSQEFSHLEELHWRPEHNGYCRFDKNGNLELVATISKRNSEDLLSLVTFDWNSLECYLSTSDQVLVRLFDFTLVDRKSFVAWGNENISFVDVSTDLFYKQCIQGTSSYTRGVQIIAPRRSKAVVSSALTSSWFGGEGKEHVDFIAQDWRNECITRISTDPAATTNYFEANGNNLPFELSPAFFNPEVLSKYKADKEKYIIRERSIQCRDSWVLEAMDENEAGQIFAYIVYLRRLPESELKYWASFNERPKAPISERARINDFEGQWVMKMDPLEKVKNIVREWDQLQYAWWKLRDIRLIDEVTVPLTSSRDE